LRASHCIVSGPLTRTVEDAALWLDLTAGPHPLDPYSLPRPDLSYREAIRRPPGRCRIAYNPTLGYASVERQVRREVEAALKTLEAVGHRVEAVEQKFPDVVLEWACLMAAEDYGVFAHDIRDETLLDPGYLPGRDLGRQATHETLGDIQRLRMRLLQMLAELFREFDLLATPTVSTVAFAAEGPLPFRVEGKAVESPGAGIAFTYPFNFSGNPAISLRAGLNDEGLPVGLQLVAPRLREDLLLQVARQYEEARPWRDKWPAL
jgi:aspartyl-tRNA(Asn)/glutamyl-tRNA(Gln) amidotransferase subunit A